MNEQLHDPSTELMACQQELTEAREQQDAIAEVLRIISRSPGNVNASLQAVADSAARLCHADVSRVWLRDGEYLSPGPGVGTVEAFVTRTAHERVGPIATAGIPTMDAVHTGRTIHAEDLLRYAEERGVAQEQRQAIAARMARSGLRTALQVPLRSGTGMTGVLSLLRRGEEPRPFSAYEIALAETFADQAAIAIENARLFAEVQESNASLTTALDRQTAIAGVLEAISRTPTDAGVALSAIVDVARRLVVAETAVIHERRGDQFHTVVVSGAQVPIDPKERERWVPLTYEALPGTVMLDSRTVHWHGTLDELRVHFPAAAAWREEQGLTAPRAIVSTPLRYGDEAIGTLTLNRPGDLPFTDDEVALVETFAAQAAIAVNNARLFEALQERNRELTEGLERERATGEVLEIISHAPTDVQPVLDAILERALRLCDSHLGAVHMLIDGKVHPAVANTGGDVPPAPRALEGTDSGRAVDAAFRRRETITFAGTVEEIAAIYPNVAEWDRLRDRTEVAWLFVPLLRAGEVVAVISIARDQATPYTAAQIALVETFADQAVIAMENARLIEELRDSLARQTATADVLQVISRSPVDLDGALVAIIERAVGLGDATSASVWLVDGDELVRRATNVADAENWRGRRIAIAEPTPMGASVREGRAVHVPDTDLADPAVFPRTSESSRQQGIRAHLTVPLLREGTVIGTLTVNRAVARPFSEAQIALIETFASQAVIAMENARLFDEIQAKNRELTEALEQQTAVANVLEAISRTPVDREGSLERIVEAATRLLGAERAVLHHVREDMFTTLYTNSPHATEDQRLRFGTYHLGPAKGSAIWAAMTSAQPVQHQGTPDEIEAEFPELAAWRRDEGLLDPVSQLTVPLLTAASAIGTIGFIRDGREPYTDAAIVLATTFADQAAIAIENARLFDEVQERNRELTETLAYQTATGDILEIISQSPTDVQPVLEAIVQRAQALGEADECSIWRIEGEDQVRWATTGERPLGYRHPYRPISQVRTAVEERQTVTAIGAPDDETARLLAEWAERQGTTSRPNAAALWVPLVRNESTIALLAVARDTPRPYSDKQIALLETFADQAVIAIENTRLFAKLQESNAALSESLEQQTATADVLSIISRSPVKLDPVLNAVLENAARLVGADHGFIDHTRALTDDTWRVWRYVFNPPPEVADLPREFEGRGCRPAGALSTQAAKERAPVQVWGEPEEIARRYPGSPVSPSIWKPQARLCVPLLRDGEAIGAITLIRLGATPFTDNQIALVQTFADQAAIAVDNAKLFEELQERNREQAEALEREQATAEVLQVISRSPENLDQSLQAVADAVARLCRADFARVWICEGENMVAGPGASLGGRADYLPGDEKVRPLAAMNGSLVRRVIDSGQVLHTEDSQQYVQEHGIPAAERGRRSPRIRRRMFRSSLGVPLLRGGTVVGVLILLRGPEPRPFSEREITLAQTFADQAVIAIENARLFEELQESNVTLREALDQQTGVAEVLRVIGASPTDLAAVFEKLSATVLRLCDASRCVMTSFAPNGRTVWQSEDQTLRRVTAEIPPDTLMGRTYLTRRPVHFSGHISELREKFRGVAERHAERIGSEYLTAYAMPVIRDGAAVGGLLVFRDEARPFTERQMALIQTFAEQAMIAIENTRLFEELQEQLEQQTATSRILEVLSGSPTDLPPVLDAVVESAARLTDAEIASIHRLVGDSRVLAAVSTSDLSKVVAQIDGQLRGVVPDRAIEERRTLHVVGEPDEIAVEYPASAEIWRQLGTRSMLVVPLLREGEPIGALSVRRLERRPFTERQIALLEIFADQAVIAIENTRLFEEIQSRTRELEAASRAKSEFLSRMSHELRTPLNAIIGFAEIMEMDQVTTARQRERVHHILQGGRHLLGLINEVLDITRIEAGRLSLSIEPVRLDAVVQEVLDLERPLAAGSDVTLELEEPDDFGVAIQADRQRLRQIVLNLVANAVKYNRPGGRVTLGCGPAAEGRIRLTVRDTGAGIPADQIGRLFAPFERLSAEASGVEGSGLGLAIARGLAEAMGGRIGAESVPGEGSAFWVELSAAATLPALPDREHLERSDKPDTRQGTATVLYIEDNQPNVDLVQHALQFRPSVTLLTAPDGATGIRIARRHRPDLILLDLNLPDLQGDDVLAGLSADERTAAIPVVMISADATQRQIDRLLAAGARDYLTKPLDVKRFLTLIDEQLDDVPAASQRLRTPSPEVRDESS